jgi:hypothetical protein
LIHFKISIMAEHTKGQDPKTRNESSDRAAGDVVRQNTSGRSTDSSLDEKSSTMGRRDKNTGLATKDGLTGSDTDGQLTK